VKEGPLDFVSYWRRVFGTSPPSPNSLFCYCGMWSPFFYSVRVVVTSFFPGIWRSLPPIENDFLYEIRGCRGSCFASRNSLCTTTFHPFPFSTFVGDHLPFPTPSRHCAVLGVRFLDLLCLSRSALQLDPSPFPSLLLCFFSSSLRYFRTTHPLRSPLLQGGPFFSVAQRRCP